MVNKPDGVMYELTQNEEKDLFWVITSAISLWGFMSVDDSLSKDERAAAKMMREKGRKILKVLRGD